MTKEIEDIVFNELHEGLVRRIEQLMKEQEISQKALAERLEKRPSEINKWLHGNHNFTLRSIAKLQAALGRPLICFHEKGKSKTEFQPDFHKVTCHLSVNRQRTSERQVAFASLS